MDTETVKVAVAPATDPGATVRVERWPSEIPLLCLVAVAAFWIWLMLAVTIFGLAYVLLIGLFFFFTHLAFVTYIRGSAVRLSPRQFPELYRRVEELVRRSGLEKMPDAYLMEAGGSLNAFATKFFRARMIVLFSDLLEACGDDESARDMVIGHEIGHLRSRHLDFHWLLLPGMFVPFLGSAYSRARELTCDRWGAALCGDTGAASRGLAILAGGGRFGPKIDLAAYVEQRRDLDTGWMTLGRWLALYPPLSKRVELLRPDLAPEPFQPTRGIQRAVAILLLVLLLPLAAMGVAFYKAMKVFSDLQNLRSSIDSIEEEAAVEVIPESDHPAARARAAEDLAKLEALLRQEWAATGTSPQEDEELESLWRRLRPDQEFPTDPFTGGAYGFYVDEPGMLMVYSAGPDAEMATADDIDHPVDLGPATGN